MYSRYCLESSKSDKNPAGEEVDARKSTESVEAAAQPSQDAHSDGRNVTVVKVKPMNKTEVHTSQSIMENEQQDQNEVHSGTSGVTSRPLGAHPNHRRSTTVNMQKKNLNHFYSRRACEDMSG